MKTAGFSIRSSANFQELKSVKFSNLQYILSVWNVSPGTHIKLEHGSKSDIRAVLGKIIIYVYDMKMYEYMKSSLLAFFNKLEAKNMVTHFTHARLN